MPDFSNQESRVLFQWARACMRFSAMTGLIYKPQVVVTG
jgi:hypothetical protein